MESGAQLRQGQPAKVSKKRPIKSVIRKKKETWEWMARNCARASDRNYRKNVL